MSQIAFCICWQIIYTLGTYVYKSQKSARMDQELFKQFFFVGEFILKTKKPLKERNLPQKALLILDNAPSHINEELISDSICALLLPPNVTSLV
jgi:hypothetical protein